LLLGVSLGAFYLNASSSERMNFLFEALGAHPQGDFVLDSLSTLEVSAMDTGEISSLTQVFEHIVSLASYMPSLAHISVHGPTKGSLMQHPTVFLPKLASAVNSLPSRFSEVNVVVHPDSIPDPVLYAETLQPRGRVLVENSSSIRSDLAGSVPLLQLASSLPSPGFCFDVSHALDVFSFSEALELFEVLYLSAPINYMHIGCINGPGSSTELASTELLFLRQVCSEYDLSSTSLVYEKIFSSAFDFTRNMLLLTEFTN